MILITGANGFIGKRLTSKLLQQGSEIIELNNLEGGVTNLNQWNQLLSCEITHVFHLAAKTFVPESWEEPNLFIETNVLGTQNALEFCRKKNASMTFISAYIYGVPQSLPISETHLVSPNNPYALSKYMSEQLCQLYANNSDIKINILRPFNVFGIGQNDEFLIPTIIRQAIYQNVIELNDLSPKRDYLYIDDMVDALISAMKYKDKSSTYNIGSGKSFSVSEIADLVLDVLGIRKPVHAKKILRQNEIPDTVADISQAKADLNWQPHHTLKEGIEKILRSEKNKHNEQTIHPN